MSKERHTTGSWAESRFFELFGEVFGPEKGDFLYSQFPFYDIYHNQRYADFVLNNGPQRIAIEIDDAATHHKDVISQDKFQDHLLRQNSMIYLGWAVYRIPVRQLQQQPEHVKDELQLFLGRHPDFRLFDDYLPNQQGSSLDAKNFELYEHQQKALDSLQQFRNEGKTIALLYHATGTGKTVTAVKDAKSVGGRTLFLAHTEELIRQSAEIFCDLWPEASVGVYMGKTKEREAQVICGSVQSVALNLNAFLEEEFDYLVIDEAHHAAADSYQKVLSFFRPKFTLGLTATPERTDDNEVILEIFQNTAHKLDIEEAVEIGVLVPVRCIRIHTNIDLTNVRFNNTRYNVRDLESKIYVPERNQRIVDTWLDFVKNRRTVVFCASVNHAEEIAVLFEKAGVTARAVSGKMKTSQRKEALDMFASGKLLVLCACDLLNEGWDCPETEVLFMARPTMSRLLYMQQLGRGMRNADGKESLMVFDFVDNASLYNMPYSMHRVFRLTDYKPGALVLAPDNQRTIEEGLYDKGERPEALIDWPVDILDYEPIDIFSWQEEAAGMISQMEFVRRVDVQKETVSRYIREGKLVSDLEVPMSEHRTFHYFTEETLEKSAKKYGRRLITDENRKEIFMEMALQMDMSYSYKPVLLKAVFAHADTKGKVFLADIVDYFREFYEDRRQRGLIVEKPNSLYAKGDYEDSTVRQNILANPFNRFEQMQMMYHTRTLGIIQIDETVWRRLSEEDKEEIIRASDCALDDYYKRL